MADKLARSVLEIAVDRSDFERGMASIEKDSARTANTVEKGLGLAIGGVLVAAFQKLAAVGVQALKAIVSKVIELGERGAAVADVAESFGQLSGQIGATADTMLGELRAGVAGTITDFELMKVANKGLAAGFLTSAQDAGTLAAGAKLLADRTGGDTKEAFEKLFQAIASGKDGQLAQLGLFIDTKKATADFAREHRITGRQLTETERATAIAQATMGALRGQLAAAGPSTLDFSDRIAQAKVALDNLTDAVGVGIARSPVLATAMGTIGDQIKLAFGGNQSTLVKAIVTGIEKAVIASTYLAQAGAMAGSVIVSAFSAVRLVVAADLAIVSMLAETLVRFINGLAQMGAAIPIVGEKVKGFAEGADLLKRNMFDLTGYLAAETRVALEGVQGHSALHQAMDKVAGVAINLRTAMQEAGAATTGASQAAQGALGTIGGAVTGAAAQVLMGARTMKAELDSMSQGVTTGVKNVMAETSKATVESFAQQRLAAISTYKTTAEAAEAAGFQTIGALKREAAVALATYEAMKASGEFTAEALRQAWEKAELAKRASTGESEKVVLTSNQALQQGAMQLYGVLAERYKAVAIAGAIISTYQAIAKALASAPWPANLALAAGAAAAGWANVAKIRSSSAGFEAGTPGLDFANFGTVFPTALHGEEAVIPRGSGHLLAGEIAAAMPGGQDSALADRMDRMLAILDAQPIAIKKAFLAALRSA